MNFFTRFSLFCVICCGYNGNGLKVNDFCEHSQDWTQVECSHVDSEMDLPIWQPKLDLVRFLSFRNLSQHHSLDIQSVVNTFPKVTHFSMVREFYDRILDFLGQKVLRQKIFMLLNGKNWTLVGFLAMQVFIDLCDLLSS